jgi:hypothetical protein
LPVYRHEQDLDVGANRPELFGELVPAHERHSDVRQEQVEGFGAAACKMEGLARVPGAQDGVSRRPQDVRGKGEDVGIVIVQEDRFFGRRGWGVAGTLMEVILGGHGLSAALPRSGHGCD